MADTPNGRARILFVDDEPNLLEGIRVGLRRAPFDISMANNAVAGLALIASEPPFGAVISDLRMPGMNGLDFLAAVGKASPDTSLILLTGYADLTTAMSAINAGHLFRFLTKPCPVETLRTALDAGIRQFELFASERRLTQELRAEIERRRVVEEELRVANAELAKLARTDALTGLLNRRSLLDCLDAEHHRLLRYGSPFAALMIDVDFFKRVNDTYGHTAGDRVLAAVAHCAASILRESDIASRYGGEEFCAVLPQCDIAAAVAVAERVREAVASLAIEWEGTAIRVTCSVGAAEASANDIHAADIIERADQALYAAKHSGRNRVVGWPLPAAILSA